MLVRDWAAKIPTPEILEGRCQWSAISGEALAPMVAAAYRRAEKPADRRILVVTSGYDSALQWEARLALLGVPPSAIHHLPSGQSSLYDDGPPEVNALSARAAALASLLGDDGCIVLASPQAALERTLSPRAFSESVVSLRLEDEVDIAAIGQKLVALGYEHEEPVRRPGTFSRRGGILDIHPVGSDFPFRTEFFGDFVESMRTFDPETQRSLAPSRALHLAPVRPITPATLAGAPSAVRERLDLDAVGENAEVLRERVESDIAAIEAGLFFDRLELYMPFASEAVFSALDYLAGGLLVLEEPVELEAAAMQAEEDLATALANRYRRGEALSPKGLHFQKPIAALAEPQRILSLTALGGKPEWLKIDENIEVGITSLAPYRGRSEALAQAIVNWRSAGLQIILTTDQPTRARQVLSQVDVPIVEGIPETKGADGPLAMLQGNLAGGFLWQDQKLVVLTDAELFGVGRLRLPQRRFQEGAPIATVLDLEPGDYVVHIQFGIGVFQGLTMREVEGKPKEFLRIDYKAPDKLLLPTDQLDRIQKYLAPSDAPPMVYRIAGGDWQRTLKVAKKKAEDLARELISIYAKRTQASRPPFDPETPWQTEMEATFPWIETKSQLKTIHEVKRDLAKPYPMDRLVCGDVGFGKTEVAVRAAFQVAQAGKQVAVLCPTTILADQHFETFRDRLGPYPIQLHLLNRFRQPKQKRATLEGIKDGSVDVVIGTHSLLQKSVEFKNLGLVVVDEEQRFGVKHKEILKKMRESADFLTLTATPIPRTLNMSLMGLRPMSLITDPPPGRLPVRTYLRPYGVDVVREALLRELARGGQIYYVYNRIDGIQHVAEKLRAIAPKARIAVGHGQMTADELEPMMNAFFHGEVDVLLSTTIIENGLDNPNANTLIVEDADRLGLAQLYQLRGRVGRSDRQAYAYLLYRPGKKLTENALARLKSLQEFSDLGSGYSLAFRDLQIRGAGELLGSQQHGTMQSVGFELYSRLIREAVEQLKGAYDEGGASAARLAAVEIGEMPEFDTLPPVDLPAAAYIPHRYIEDESQRLYYYKHLMEARSEDAIVGVEEELRDRYGPLPDEIETAAWLIRLRLRCREMGITRVEGRFGKMTISYAKGKELPLRVVHAIEKAQKGLRQRSDRIEVRYGTDALSDLAAYMDSAVTAVRQYREALNPR
ncbi:MAG: transcription-repair coupling factor [Armatimonadota bacterium]|nr:transcription-repair coupling factor [Armatimonadota bacterium]